MVTQIWAKRPSGVVIGWPCVVIIFSINALLFHVLATRTCDVAILSGLSKLLDICSRYDAGHVCVWVCLRVRVIVRVETVLLISYLSYPLNGIMRLHQQQTEQRPVGWKEVNLSKHTCTRSLQYNNTQDKVKLSISVQHRVVQGNTGCSPSMFLKKQELCKWMNNSLS